MTQREYEIGLARVESENPREILLPELRQGFSAARCLYLRAALRRLPAVELSDFSPIDEKSDIEETDAMPETSDEGFRHLWRERGRIYVQMRKTRNEYHDCKSDSERRSVNARLQTMWAEFEAVKRKIAHFEAHGEHEPEASAERFPLPSDPFALSKKLDSLRSLISQEEKKLRELAALPKDHPQKAEKIQKSEARRADLILYRNHAERAIEAARVQSRGLEGG